MQYKRLGETGLQVSRVCLGTMSYGSPEWREWVLAEEQGRPFIKRALELGINFFDTADMYSLGRSEEILGRALADFARRREVVIATKVYFPMGEQPNQRGLSRKHIMQSIDASLKRLRTDYVDLYQIHRWDQLAPIEETLEALNDVVRAGKALYIGASSMAAWQFCKALFTSRERGWSRFVSMQNHYNLLNREEEREMLPLCRDQGIGVIPWSPLARGFLTGNRSRQGEGSSVRSRSDPFAQQLYFESVDFDITGRVVSLAQRRGVTPAQIALAWLLQQPAVTAPIVGATKMHHLEEAAQAVELELSEEECAYLEELYQPRPGSFPE